MIKFVGQKLSELKLKNYTNSLMKNIQPQGSCSLAEGVGVARGGGGYQYVY